MRANDVLLTAFTQLRANKFRAFFTLLGIMVSVAFLVAVIAIINGMNVYVSEQVAGSLIGKDVFQVRRGPISLGLIDDEALRKIQKRPRITLTDAAVLQQELPEAAAISLQSGWPTPLADVEWRNRTVGSATVFGVTADFQRVQDYRFESGNPLTDLDVRERRRVVVIGNDIAKNLFDGVDPIGQEIRLKGQLFSVVGVVAPKGRVLGQSFDGFILMPISAFESLYGRRLTTTISVKMADPAALPAAMGKAQEAMRLAHRLRPGEADDFSIETADALVDFWKKLTKTLFSIIPAVVAIGIVVGGVVIMNIMLMSVTERTREIGIRMAVGASRGDIRKQFLAESVAVSALGGVLGLALGALLAWLVSALSPLPARVTPWSITVALALGASVGVLFGVYPAARAARLDPIDALRSE
ncbi:MAG: ABC transporter permease [Gemmatimonadaceae bacterium]|nr:ABC transporter permease [Gemmatimonadaceae bacterium]